MRITERTFLVISQLFIFLFALSALASNNNYKENSKIPVKVRSIDFYAVNDTFNFVTNCESNLFYDNVIKNDVFQDSENAQVCYVFAPEDGVLTFGTSGNFTLTLPNNYSGTLEFRYSLCDKSNSKESSEAKVVIIVKNDNDCDGITNDLDLDNDNDGILDLDEGNGMLDSDSDGITDNFDIDSDDDGITDNEEWQEEGYYFAPSEIDDNNNGWDDAYDIDLQGVYYEPIDTDQNGIPDYMDSDSDGDGTDDNLEAFDMNNDGLADILRTNLDNDSDGLDDAYDLISCCSEGYNSTGSLSPLPDLDNNGVRDWRDSWIRVGKYNSSSAFDFLVYPIPSSGSFTISTPLMPENMKLKLHVFTILGVEMYNKTITSGVSEINIGEIASGSYILQINTEYGKYQSVISIQK